MPRTPKQPKDLVGLTWREMTAVEPAHVQVGANLCVAGVTAWSVSLPSVGDRQRDIVKVLRRLAECLDGGGEGQDVVTVMMPKAAAIAASQALCDIRLRDGLTNLSPGNLNRLQDVENALVESFAREGRPV